MKPAFLGLALSLFASISAMAQYTVEQHRSGALSYESVTNDHLGVRKYVLKNGLTVYTSVQRDEPRIQTLISVRTGSANDPSNATGLAHYLEHMLFKGTDRYGTADFAKEQPLIARIEELFETYRQTRDSLQRKSIYHQIDSLSGIAATFAIPGEYDRMTKRMGATGTNAHTSNDETVYENNIPRNQFERWVSLEAERFRKPVLRLFHTELEAVYEEKNRGMDNDPRLVNEALMEAVFPKHPYGTQTTIGTIEHLKNPSMREIRKYYDTYYVPNNMAIILVGDLDPDACVAMIEKAFEGLPSKPLPPAKHIVEDPITSPIVRELASPAAETVSFAFRFPGAGAKELNLLTMCDMLLANSSAGLIDLNLVQKQKVLSASCSPQFMKDYSLHRFSVTPRRGQKLEDARDLVLAQIEELKQGNFSDATLKAVVNDLRITHLKQMEEIDNRAGIISRTFILGEEWKDFISQLDALSALTKNDIVEFAKKSYSNNYAIVFKRNGEKKVEKVVKPEITAVKINSDKQSDFATKILAMPVARIEPKFSDFSKDITRRSLSNGAELLHVKNTENSLYNLNFVWDYGTRHNTKYSTAMQYLDFIGAGMLGAADLKTKLYELGCSIRVSASTDAMTVELSGSAENLVPALQLIDMKFTMPKADTAALKLLVDGIIKQRSNVKKNKNVILNQALLNYATYGKRNPFTTIQSEQELRKLTADDLLSLIKQLNGIQHKIEYYGPQDVEDVKKIVEANHTMPKSLEKLQEPEPFVMQDNAKGIVYFLDFDMVQAEVLMRIKTDQVYSTKNSSFSRIYNEYMGGLSGVVFQTIRESKALAYSVSAGFMPPRKVNDPYYFVGYVGTQADKLPEALTAMHEVLKTIPHNESTYANARQSVIEKMEADRVTKMGLIQQYDNLRRLGLDRDVRPELYSIIPTISLDDLQRLRDEKLGDKKFTIVVMGSKSRIKKEDLEKYGEVQTLTLEDVFGY